MDKLPSLIDLRNVIRDKRKISLIELANEFRVPKTMLEIMLEKLVARGEIGTWETKASSCGCSGGCGCAGASEEPVRWYRWTAE